LSRPINDDWFDAFCSKVAPCYVLSEDEASQQLTIQPLQSHVLLNPFFLSELMYAFSSRPSSASVPDNISHLMLINLLPNALEVLLRILNNFQTTHRLLSFWFYFRVIPIPKANSTTSFRPIAVSYAICEIFEHMLKSCRITGNERADILAKE